MDGQLLLICLLTASINLIGSLAYAARIAGIRTGRIAMSFALFNLLVLVSRMSNSFLGPFLAKRIETRISAGGGQVSLVTVEYDITDYRDIDPLFGTLDDFRVLVKHAHDLGLKVMVDQVLSHTSDQHPWFQASRHDRNGPYGDYYVWSDTNDKWLDARVIFTDVDTSVKPDSPMPSTASCSRNRPTSVTMPMAWNEPRSASLVTTARWASLASGARLP